MKVRVLSKTLSVLSAETSEDVLFMFQHCPTVYNEKGMKPQPTAKLARVGYDGGFISGFPFEKFQCTVNRGEFSLKFMG